MLLDLVEVQEVLIQLLSADPSKQNTVREDSKVKGVFERLQEAPVVHKLQETSCQNRKIGKIKTLAS